MKHAGSGVAGAPASALRRTDGSRAGCRRSGGVRTAGYASPRSRSASAGSRVVLGGEWRAGDAPYFVVESRREPRRRTVGRRWGAARAPASAPRGRAAGRRRIAPTPFLFFDLETTGLSGGAGTHAFLVGCAWFDEDGAFVTRQFMLVRFADERALLGRCRRARRGRCPGQLQRPELRRAAARDALSLPSPRVDRRALPHLDMLHVARRFWGEADVHASGPESAVPSARSSGSCSGTSRRGDVPGFEIPARYFQFVRTGDARPLAAVFEHNRLDLLSLAALTAGCFIWSGGAGRRERSARSAGARPALCARRARAGRAREAYERGRPGPAPSTAVHVDALARSRSRGAAVRTIEERPATGGRSSTFRGCPRHVAREASEALAIHHEHRAHDLRRRGVSAAQPGGWDQAAWNEGGRHRLARIERKIGESELRLAESEWPRRE